MQFTHFPENEPFMSYQRFKKGGRVAKSQFLAKKKKCAKIVALKNYKNGLFAARPPFLNH